MNPNTWFYLAATDGRWQWNTSRRNISPCPRPSGRRWRKSGMQKPASGVYAVFENHSLSSLVVYLKGDIFNPQVWVWSAITTRLGNQPITGGRVRLDVCWMDQSTSPTQWTVANVAHLSVTHLGGHAHLWCQKLHIIKTACDGFSHSHLVV